MQGGQTGWPGPYGRSGRRAGTTGVARRAAGCRQDPIGRLSSAQEKAVRLPGLNLTLTVKHRVNRELRRNTETARGGAPCSPAGDGCGRFDARCIRLGQSRTLCCPEPPYLSSTEAKDTRGPHDTEGKWTWCSRTAPAARPA